MKKLENFLVISTYFNYFNQKEILDNFRVFSASLKKQGVSLCAIEMAYKNNSFELEENDSDIRIQVRSNSMMWQKERLLNIALGKLPHHYTKIAWIDADVIFLDENWAKKAVSLLNRKNAIQLFSWAVNLPKDKKFLTKKELTKTQIGLGEGKRFFGAAYSLTKKKDPDFSQLTFSKIGRTGLGWAYNRNCLKGIGFFDLDISADLLAVVAMFTNKDSSYTKDLIPNVYQEYSKWRKVFYKRINRKVGFINEPVMHLWHGPSSNRKQRTIRFCLNKFWFDPTKDVVINQDDCFEIKSNWLAKNWLKGYFYSRSLKNQLALSIFQFFLFAVYIQFGVLARKVILIGRKSNNKRLPLELTSTRPNKSSLWAVTSYFNPEGYTNIKRNLVFFRKELNSQKVPLVIVELAFGKKPFELCKKDADILIQVRSNSVMWQKERLLNIGINSLPKSCKYVALIDADIIFLNPNWKKRTIRALKKWTAVQPFNEVFRLGRDSTDSFIKGNKNELTDTQFEFGYLAWQKQKLAIDKNTGFAIAFRKNILDKNYLYDKMVLGGGDRMILSALMKKDCFNFDYLSKPLKKDSKTWIKKIRKKSKGKIGFISSKIIHLWHGERRNRFYNDRYEFLRFFNFSPKDLKLNKDGCFEWKNHDLRTTLLAKSIALYFKARSEDSNKILSKTWFFLIKGLLSLAKKSAHFRK